MMTRSGVSSRIRSSAWLPSAGPADHLDALDVGEEGAQPVERQRFVVHQQYAHRLEPPTKA